ncbi:MAG: PQQ-binding-like beta-propeller repeat protein [Gemmataceae bacterium]|nr:PQQ-binding-like beta-propeller repeat protein [Gemmataceae bacterium]
MRSFSRCLWLLLIGGGAGVSAAAADWPGFRGPGAQGISSERGLPVTWSKDQNLLWKSELPGAGASSPILIGRRIFLTCHSGYSVPGQRGELDQLKRHVVCLDRATGKSLWSREVESKQPEEAKIREAHGYASSTPVADWERVYAFFGKSGVFALDHNGKQLWHADVGSGLSGWGTAASPVLFGDLVIVNASVESQSLVALDRKTGKERWRAGGIKESWNTPVVVTPPGGKPELVVAIMGKVLGFEPNSGQLLWSCSTDIGWYMVPTLAIHEGVVYCIGGRSGKILALAVRAGGRGDVTRSHRLWTGPKGSNVSSPVFHEGHLYWANDGQEMVYCAEAQTGRIVYEQRLPRAGQIYASPVLADGKLYYVSRTGRTFVLAARPKFEQLAVNDLGERATFNASPAVADGRLFLRSDRFLYCIGKGR